MNSSSQPAQSQRHGTVWPGLRLTAASGITVVYGGRSISRHPPKIRRRGIGIKVKGKGDSWNGLLDKKLHQMRFAHLHGHLRLPVMGMPPRELEPTMMKAVRQNLPVQSWFQKGAVFSAQTFLGRNGFKIRRHSNDSRNANVIMTLPSIPGDPQMYEYETAIPLVDVAYDTTIDPRVKQDMNNLYFIQILPNELPSFHFWYNPEDPHSGNRPIKLRELIVRRMLRPTLVALDNNGKVSDQTRQQIEAEHLTSKIESLRIRAEPPQPHASSSSSSSSAAATAAATRGTKGLSTPAPSTSPAADSAKTAKNASSRRQQKTPTAAAAAAPARQKRSGSGKRKAKQHAMYDPAQDDEFVPDQDELNEPQEVRKLKRRKVDELGWKPSVTDVDDEGEDDEMEMAKKVLKPKTRNGKGKKAT